MTNGPPPESPAEALARIEGVLARHGVTEFAITGSVALGVWATPRETRDVDLCGVIPLGEVDRLLAQHDGVRGGAGELPDVIRFRVGSWDVDLFVCKSHYDEVCLRRAVRVDLAGTGLRVVTPEDLLVHKAIKLRTDRRRVFQDLADLRLLVEARGASIDWAYVHRWIRESERALLDAVRSLDDEAALRALQSSNP